MKTKKIAVTIISVILVITAVILVVFSSQIRNGFADMSAKKYTNVEIVNSKNIFFVSKAINMNGKSNTVSGFKEAVRLGAKGVIADICFKNDGTPFMSDNYEKSDSSEDLEKLFKAFISDKFSSIKIYLNIVQLSELSKLNELVSKYDMQSRIALMGIDDEHYGLITSDQTIIPIYIDYKFSSKQISEMENGKFSIPDEIGRYGVTGLVIQCDDYNETICSTLNEYGIPVLVSDIENNKQLSEAIVGGGQYFVVNDIEQADKFFKKWISNVQISNRSQVDKSLNDLSTTK